MFKQLKPFQPRFRLSVLLLLLTVTCLWLGWTTYFARRQSDATKAISRAEGIITYRHELDAKGSRIPNPPPPAPTWLMDAIGEDYFRSPTSVDFATNLGRRQGSDEPKATPDSLQALGKLTSVETIELSHNESVNDDALQWLSSLTSLRVLYLYNTEVTGNGLEHLKDVPLVRLELSHSPVTNDGLAHIGAITTLEYLGLKNASVNDSGLHNLNKLQKLRELRLTNTDVTDAGLQELSCISSLAALSLGGTRVTADGIEDFKAALPGCRVIADHGLGKSSDNELLFPAGYHPTTDEIEAMLKKRGIEYDIQIDNAKPDKPVRQFQLEESALGAKPILQFVHAMPKLEFLSVQHSLAGDALLEGLSKCENLTLLVIRGGRLSDAGLAYLKDIPKLQEIEFHEQTFTDASIEHLGQLQQLRSLYMEESKLTDEGRQALKEALPNCRLNLR